MDDRTLPPRLLAAAERTRDRFLAFLQTIVDIDSGTDDPQGVDRVGAVCVARLEAGGWDVVRTPDPRDTPRPAGDVITARRAGKAVGGARILLLAHLDTVFPRGTAARRPFRTADGRAFGPGVADDKDGVVVAIEAVDLLTELGADDYGEVVLVLSSDEETGSPASTHVIEQAAREVDVALCLESARSNGAIVSARKGVSDLVVEIDGRASHAGVEPEKGASAALEAARQTVAIHALNGRWDGVTCNVGVLQAGSRPNIVADHARLEVDVRAWTREAFEAAVTAIEAIAAQPTVEGTRTSVRRETLFPPMERTPAVAALVATAREVGRGLGIDLHDTATGGGSDASTVAALGVPVLDGLAPIGGDAHAPTEWLDLDSVAPRTALLAGLVQRLGSRTPSHPRQESS